VAPKLRAKELGRRATGRTLYLLDEPTTGLHPADTARLLNILQRLVDAGNSVVVVEHNLDLVRAADWVIDLGPEGGAAGGRLLAEGTPEDLARVIESYTGQCLKELSRERSPLNEVVQYAAH
jgi:excinuclease ABC subunit A